MSPNAAQLRQLKRDNLQYPRELRPIPRHEWPIPPFVEEHPRIAVYRSRQFLTQVFDQGGGILRMSVNRTEWDERQKRFREDISWDELQRLKTEAGYPNRWAVEVYPANEAIVNVANMRHLWLLPEAPAFAWNVHKKLAA